MEEEDELKGKEEDRFRSTICFVCRLKKKTHPKNKITLVPLCPH